MERASFTALTAATKMKNTLSIVDYSLHIRYANRMTQLCARNPMLNRVCEYTEVTFQAEAGFQLVTRVLSAL